jgi:predicted metalloprotease with PDZ domain
MLRLNRCTLALFTSLLATAAQADTHYQLDLAGHDRHQVAVNARFVVDNTEPLLLQMSAASPGRYARHDFAKNIYALKALDGQGNPLLLQRMSPTSWQVSGHQGEVQVSYLLFGNHADGTYNQIDSRHVHLNMPASLLFAPSLRAQPATVSLKTLPTGWRAATQLYPQAEGALSAPDVDYLMDSPLEISDHQLLSFSQASAGKTYQIELALHHAGSAEEAKVLLEKTQAVVRQQQAIFGELPDFANQRYTFIADYLPGVDGDGMEHRNSTIVTSESSLAQDEFAQVETISHEFFHAWNVERLRPKNLQPFDYTQTNMSDALWFAEGFTNYYGKLALKRSSHFDLDTYLDKVQKPLNQTLQTPARRWSGPAAVSQQAVFVDAGVAVDKTNYANHFLSYYTYGEVVALALDLTLRTQYDTDLDALMRLMWQRFGKPETPYQLADIQQALAEVSGDAEFAAAFFRDSIQGPGLPDFTALFTQMGLTLSAANPDKAWLGALQLASFGDAVQVQSVSRDGSPWASAGITDGDLLLQLGPVRLRTPDDIDTALNTARPGDVLVVKFRRFDREQSVNITVAADPALALRVDKNASRASVKRRDAWLGAKKL